MRQETINIYYINEHPNKNACFEWIRNNWHDLGDHAVEDFAQSLRALAEYVGGSLDYALCIVPDRSERATIKDYDKDLLKELYAKKDECPLTGVYSDINVIEGLHDGELIYRVTKSLHTEGDYIYSDEGLQDMCEANGYEFYANGDLV